MNFSAQSDHYFVHFCSSGLERCQFILLDLNERLAEETIDGRFN